MLHAEKVQILAPYLLAITLFIVAMNLLIYSLYWKSRPTTTTRNFGIYWLVQLVGLLLSGVFTENHLLMGIPFSASIVNFWIIYKSFIKDLEPKVLDFKVFLYGYGVAWCFAFAAEITWNDFTYTTMPLAIGLSLPAIYIMKVLGQATNSDLKTFHHKLLFAFMPFSIVHIYNFPLFRGDETNRLWGLTVHILLIIAGSINLTMFHTYILELADKKKLKGLVELRTEELNRRLSQLQVVNEEKSALFRIVLHDVSNPMSAIMGYLDFALNPKIDETTKHKYLQGALRSAKTVTTTIRQIRSMESMAETKKRFYAEEIDLHEAFATVETIFRPQFDKKNVTLKVDYPNEEIYLTGNKDLFCQSVLGNLVSNSLKFSHPGSTVYLTSKKENGNLKILVRDEGTGFEKTKIANMFDVSKSESCRGTQGESGTGFGMPLLKRYLDVVKGDIDIQTITQEESQTDHGTKVELSFQI